MKNNVSHTTTAGTSEEDIQKKTKETIFLATPCYGGMVTTEFMTSVIGCSAGKVPITLMTLGDDALIPRARNTLLANFYYRSNCSHILFVDADIGFDHNAPERLLKSGKDVIAGTYPIRDRFWDNITKNNILAGEAQRTASLRYVGETKEIHDSWEKGPLVQVPFVGTGFMMISRKAVEAMIKAYPETEYKKINCAEDQSGMRNYALFDGSIDPDDGTYLSEDFTFCRRWRQIGGEVWLDMSIDLSHTGRAKFFGNPFVRLGINHNRRTVKS